MFRVIDRLILFLLVWALTLLCAVAARAEVGHDYLGIKSRFWNCDAQLAAVTYYPKLPIGWLDDDTFIDKSAHYDPDACLRRTLGSGKVSSARAHLLNNTCVRNRKCTRSDKLFGYTLRQVEREACQPNSRLSGLLRSGAARILGFSQTFPQVVFRISGLLEHDLSPNAAACVVSTIGQAAPGIAIVDNGMRSYPNIPGVLVEKHSQPGRSLVAAPLVSTDGVSVEDIAIERLKAMNAPNDLLLWSRAFNCRLEKGWVDPPKRKDCPSPDLFLWATRVLYPQPIWPPGAPRIGSGETYKNFAEFYGGADRRGNKAMFIVRARQTSIGLHGMNGAPITSCRFGGTFVTPGYNRYYCPITSFQLGQAGETISQSEYVWVRTNRGAFVVDAYRRDGSFR